LSGIVNLRIARKQRKRAQARTAATVEAAAAGEGKASTRLRTANDDLAARRLDQHRRDAPEDA